MTEFSGQVALVTGGVRGMGRAIAEALLERGARVAVGYSRSWTAAEAFAAAHDAQGVSVHQGRIGDPDDCERVVQEVVDRHGRLDILVNGAGLTVDPETLPGSEAWTRAVDTNIAGAFAMAEAAQPHMLAQNHGRIIGISPAGPDDPQLSDATSAVQFELTVRLAERVAGHGVTVNCITPGEQWPLVPPEASPGAPDDPDRAARAAEVTRLAMLLASPNAGEINGQVYSLDGGLNLCVRRSQSMTFTKRSTA